MKKILTLSIILISISYSQTSTKKWDELRKRYDITYSDGTRCWEKYDNLRKRWESNCPD